MPRHPHSSISSATIWWPLLLCSITLRQRKSSKSRFARHLTGADYGAPGGAFVLASKSVRHDELAELLDKPVIAAQVVIILGRRRHETDFDRLCGGRLAGGEEIHELRRQVARHDGEAFAFLYHLHAKQVGKSGDDEVLHRFRVADGLIDCTEVFLDFVRLDRVLGKNAARGGLAAGGFINLSSDSVLGSGGFFERIEVEKHLPLFAPHTLDTAIRVKQEGLRDGIDNALRVLRKWDVDPGGALDFPHFTEKHIQHDPVDRVVSAIEETGFYLGGLLAKAVNTAFALFEAVGIPWKIVMEDAGKEVL